MGYNSEQFKGGDIRSKRRNKQKGRRLQERYLFRADSEIQETKEPERKIEERVLKKEISEQIKSPDVEKKILQLNIAKAFNILEQITELEIKKNNEEVLEGEPVGKLKEADDIVKKIEDTQNVDEQIEYLKELDIVYESMTVEDLIDGVIKDYREGKLENQEVFNITGELRRKMAERGYTVSQRDEAVEQLARKLNWEIGEDGIIRKIAEVEKPTGEDTAVPKVEQKKIAPEVDNLIQQVINEYKSGLIQVRGIKDLGSELRKRMPTKAGYDWQQRDAAVEKLFSMLELQEKEAKIKSKAKKIKPEIKLSAGDEPFFTLPENRGLYKKEYDEILKRKEELKNAKTEELKDRYLALWGERSRVLGGNMPDRTEKFRNVETKIGEIEKQFAKLGVKIDLFGWISGKEEEAKGSEAPAEPVSEIKEDEKRETKFLKKEIFADILNKFNQEFNISEKELEQIENFNSLSEGQQLLILENLKQLTLGRIQEESAIKYKKNIAETKFLSRIWQGISKKYQIVKLEKETAEKITQGGIKAHGIVLQQLANGLKEFGPEVEIKDGKLEIQFASGLGHEHKEQLNEFNRIANEFSRMPYEWSLETASRKEQEAYNRTKEQYEEIKINILNIKKEKEGDREACLFINDVEGRVKLNQFLNTHPEVEEQLRKIKDKKVWLRAWANIATERGIYAGAGFITRTATMSLVGLAGAPLAAATVGGWMARRRGKESLKERDILARKGLEDKGKETKNFVDAEKLQEKLKTVINKINSENNDEQKEKLFSSLKTRIKYTQEKINDGLINFGGNENRLANQLNIITALKEAEIFSEINNAKKIDELEERLERFLELKKEKISNARRKYLLKQTAYGAGMAGVFFAGGYAIRHFAGEWFGWDKQPKGVLSAKEQDLKETLARLHKQEIEQLQKPGFIKNMEEMERAPAKPGDKLAVGLPAEAMEKPGEAAIKEAAEIKAKFDLATIRYKEGINKEGIEHALRRQLEAEPENYGYEGDINDKQAIHKWSGGEAHRAAIKAGYVNPETGEEIRVGAKGIDKAAYVLEKNAQGKTQIHEYFKGEDGSFKSQEARELAEDFKGAKFEGADKEFYEYEHKGGVKERVLEAARAARGAAESEESVRHIDLSEAVEADKVMPAGDEAIAKLETEYGITEEIMEKLKINPRDGLSADEGDKIFHLMNHKNNLEQAAESIKMVEGSGVSYDDAYEYFYQLKNVSGNPGRMEGIVEILKHHDYKSGLSKILGIAVTEKNFEVKGGGVYRIKDFKPGFDYVVKIDGGEIKFGVDGPLGQWNWGARGRTWRAYIDADLTNENIKKSKSEVENMLRIFEKKK